MTDDVRQTTEDDARRVFEAWHLRIRAGDAAGVAALYALDATLQSPLVPTYYGPDVTKIRGRQSILEFIQKTIERRPVELLEWHRDGFMWNGRTLFWEYPAETPQGRSQLDLAEVMDLEGGLIAHHRIYWGWNAVENLKRSIIQKLQPVL